MKKECDANGLEYELLMQESAKERFLRQVKASTFDLNKHLVILKQKRQNAAPADSIVAQPEPEEAVNDSEASQSTVEEQIVAAFAPEEPSIFDNAKENVGIPLTQAWLPKGVMSKLTAPKLLVLLRERVKHAKATPPPFTYPTIRPLPSVTYPSISWPTPSSHKKFSIPSLPVLGPV